MKIEYDKRAKAIYIPLIDIPNGGVAHTEEIVPNTIFLDKDKRGQIIGIEVLGVEEIVHPKEKA